MKKKSANKASSQLHKLFRDEWESTLKENPLFATNFGDHRYDDKLPSVPEKDIEQRYRSTCKYLKRLNAIDRSKLSPEDKINYDIFRRFEENEIEGHQFRSYLMPITKTGGFHSHFPELRLFVPLKTTKDYENYISRLNYKRLLKVRKENVALQIGNIEIIKLKGLEKNILSYKRMYESDQIFVHLNFQNEIIKFNSPINNPDLIFSTLQNRIALKPENNQISLYPYEGIIIK